MSSRVERSIRLALYFSERSVRPALCFCDVGMRPAMWVSERDTRPALWWIGVLGTRFESKIEVGSGPGPMSTMHRLLLPRFC